MIDVSELMSDPEFVTCVTIERPTNSFDSTNSGQVQTVYRQIKIQAIFQPASPREVETLDEGLRSHEIVAVWSAVEMFVTDGKDVLNDLIAYQGNKYQVVKCDRWGDGGYFQVFAKRIP